MSASEGKMLKAEGLNKSFKHRHVVNNVSLEFRTGEVVGLLGPNGAGKTTSFYMIVGLIQADSGRVSIDGRDITPLHVYQRARLGIGYLPQEASVFRNLTVRENIELVLQERGRDEKESRQIVDALIEEFGLEKLVDVKGFSLSGGERRRLEVARTLALDPDFILLDEPFAGIDPIAVNDIQQIVKTLKDKGYGIMITDHNVRDTLAITDRAYIIYQGEIKVKGTSQEIAEDPFARKYYLGDSFRLD
ncbi:MAG: LPS export ABC transporter ATP-binding protein [Pyramidobacter sp.]|jgi:lipopolysaccharide export system ATP-binding protein